MTETAPEYNIPQSIERYNINLPKDDNAFQYDTYPGYGLWVSPCFWNEYSSLPLHEIKRRVLSEWVLGNPDAYNKLVGIGGTHHYS